MYSYALIQTEPTSIKAEPITSATTTPTKGDPAWNAAVNERYAAMLGTSIAELMEKKKRQSAMAAASEQGQVGWLGQIDSFIANAILPENSHGNNTRSPFVML